MTIIIKLFFIFLFIIMQNLKIFEKSQPIVDCTSYSSGWETRFELMIIVVSFNWEVSSTWKKIPTRTVQSFRIFKKSLPDDIQKLKDAEICQVLKWKALLTTTSIAW